MFDMIAKVVFVCYFFQSVFPLSHLNGDNNDELKENRIKELKLGKRSMVMAPMTSNKSIHWTFPIYFKYDPDPDISTVINLRSVVKFYRSFSVNNYTKNVFINAVKWWEDNTCVTFQRNDDVNSETDDYIFVTTSTDCATLLGKITGEQLLMHGPGCNYVGYIVHELGHVLGLHHEHMRSDRDKYVKINKGYLNDTRNFAKVNPGEVAYENVIPYDLGSIMQYPMAQLDFEYEPGTKIVKYYVIDPFDPLYLKKAKQHYIIYPIDPLYINTVGQNDSLRFNDIRAINFMYCSGICRENLPCQRSGYPDPKDCQKCKCPEGFGGTYCEQVTVCVATKSNCGELILRATESEQTLTQKGDSECNYLITSDLGTNIQLEFSGSKFFCDKNIVNPCQLFRGYVELRYQGDLSNSGIRLCCNFPKIFVSKGNEAMLLYLGKSDSQLTVTYKQVSSINGDLPESVSEKVY